MADKKKKEILDIRAELYDIANNKNINHLCGNPFISDAVTRLRLLGVKIQLPQAFTCCDTYNYFEICADIVRQIDDYLHPIKNWFLNHIDTLVSSLIGIGALIVAIIAL